MGVAHLAGRPRPRRAPGCVTSPTWPSPCRPVVWSPGKLEAANLSARGGSPGRARPACADRWLPGCGISATTTRPAPRPHPGDVRPGCIPGCDLPPADCTLSAKAAPLPLMARTLPQRLAAVGNLALRRAPHCPAPWDAPPWMPLCSPAPRRRTTHDSRPSRLAASGPLARKQRLSSLLSAARRLGSPWRARARAPSVRSAPRGGGARYFAAFCQHLPFSTRLMAWLSRGCARELRRVAGPPLLPNLGTCAAS